jgi:hypothetical protein
MAAVGEFKKIMEEEPEHKVQSVCVFMAMTRVGVKEVLPHVGSKNAVMIAKERLIEQGHHWLNNDGVYHEKKYIPELSITEVTFSLNGEYYDNTWHYSSP